MRATAAAQVPRSVVFGLALLLGVGVTAASLPANADYPLVAVLLGLVAGAFGLVLRWPVWAIAPMLVVEFSIRYYQIPGVAAGSNLVSLRLLVVLTAVLLSAALLVRWGPGLVQSWPARQVLVPAVLFVALATSFDLPRVEADAAMQYLRYQLTELSALFLIACLVRRTSDLRLVLWVGLALMVASAALGVVQYVTPDHAIFAGVPVGDPAETGQPVVAYDRTIGLSSGPIQLAGAAGVALPLLMGMLACGGLRRGRSRWWLVAAAGLIGTALYLSFTRSTVLAVAAGLAAMAIFLPLERRIAVWAALGAVLALFVLLQGSGVIGARYYADARTDDSAAAHLALLEAGTAIAVDNPLIGIGKDKFDDVAPGYAGSLSPDARVAGGQASLGLVPPHNDYLMVWVSWGLPALALYLAILVGALANCVFVALRTRDGLARGVAVGTLGALISYAVDSVFHNELDTTLLLFMCAGLSIALARMPLAAEGWRPLTATDLYGLRRNYAMVRGLYAHSHPGDRR